MKTIIILLLLLSVHIQLYSQINFADYFEDKSLRIDYIHAGNADTAFVFIEQLKEEPYWGGSKKNLIDNFEYGKYMVSVYDSLSFALLYSRGYCSLFEEWQTTKEAKTAGKSFYETVIVPYPKATILVKFEERDKQNNFHVVNQFYINPESYFIVENQEFDFNIYEVLENGDPAIKVDIVIIAEGYQNTQFEKFHSDCNRFKNYLFSLSPYKENMDKFNIYGIESFSKDEGTDSPGENIWKVTIVNSNFYTFGSERYLTTSDIKSVRDIASLVPYDQIYVLVNTNKYGGGGIYNHYSLCVSDNTLSDKIFVHEFGHGFAALADEYWTSDVAYLDYYDLNYEPYQPNITTLVEFDKKWKYMVDNDTPVPTPDIKIYKNTIGVFEGGGYLEKGIYRPLHDCLMKSFSADSFCPVCQKAIQDMIDFYSE